MLRKIAVVGSKSLDGSDKAYRIIYEIIGREQLAGDIDGLVIVNGGEEGVDSMALELAMSCGIGYELVPLSECTSNCNPGRRYCFKHSYEPRSKQIAAEAEKVYRVYDPACGASTCEVTARFGEALGKSVERIQVVAGKVEEAESPYLS